MPLDYLIIYLIHLLLNHKRMINVLKELIENEISIPELDSTKKV